MEKRIRNELIDLQDCGFNVRFVETNSSFKNSIKAIIIEDFALPSNMYVDRHNRDVSKVKIMITIPFAYPRVRLDMFWVSPYLFKKGNRYRNPYCLRHTFFENSIWQMWSKHYPSWDPIEKNLTHHFLMAKMCLEKGW